MTAKPDYEELFFERANSTLKWHGILSIVFGSLGALFGLLFVLFMGLGFTMSLRMDDALAAFAIGLITFILWVIPHVYLIIAGVQLSRRPDPKAAKVLVIINLVIGLFWNLVLLIFAIINLTQMADYERGYKKFADKK